MYSLFNKYMLFVYNPVVYSISEYTGFVSSLLYGIRYTHTNINIDRVVIEIFLKAFLFSIVFTILLYEKMY